MPVPQPSQASASLWPRILHLPSGFYHCWEKKVPNNLKIFLTAFAIIDDLGAILIIAIFYTKELSGLYLGIAIGIWLCLFVLNRMRIHHLAAYIIPGIVMWYCMLQSGIHATLSGLLLAFVLP